MNEIHKNMNCIQMKVGDDAYAVEFQDVPAKLTADSGKL